jgi:hypothetical protein
MEHRSVVIRRHAIFMRQYRRVVAAISASHTLCMTQLGFVSREPYAVL